MATAEFFEALAKIPEGDPRWADSLAVFGVLSIAEDAVAQRQPDIRRIRETRQRVRGIADVPLNRHLRETLHTCALAAVFPEHYTEILARQFYECGETLHNSGDFGEAVAVFAFARDHAQHDVELRLNAIRGRAYAFRQMSEWDESLDGYRELCEVANELGIASMELDGWLGIARVTTLKGNRKDGRAMIADLIAEAERRGDTAFLADTLIDQSFIAGEAHEFSDAIAYAREALRFASGGDRDRCCVNIATAYRELDCPVESKVFASRVFEDWTYADMRTEAAIILYDCATDERDGQGQTKYREWLAGANLTPIPHARFRYAVSRDRMTAGDAPGAIIAIEEYLAVATANELHDFKFRGDMALWDIANGRVPVVYEYRPVSEESQAAIIRHAAVTRPHDETTLTSPIPVAVGVVTARS